MPQVVNGERSEYGQWPWQISLRQWRTGISINNKELNNKKVSTSNFALKP